MLFRSPTFIRMFSKDWMETDKEFVIDRTPCGTGMFAETVRRYPGAVRSLHPTKSVATIGPIASEILGEHHKAEYAFGNLSPFMKLLNYDVKVVGLGVPMWYLSMVHTVEDCFPDEFPVPVNEERLYRKLCVDKDGKKHVVHTRVHNLGVVAKANPEKFVKRYVDKSDYLLVKWYLTPFFMVRGKALYEALEKQMRLGHTIYDEV